MPLPAFLFRLLSVIVCYFGCPCDHPIYNMLYTLYFILYTVYRCTPTPSTCLATRTRTVAAGYSLTGAVLLCAIIRAVGAASTQRWTCGCDCRRNMARMWSAVCRVQRRESHERGLSIAVRTGVCVCVLCVSASVVCLLAFACVCVLLMLYCCE